ncbi:hypothetical protein SAY87_017388 [Trapa incisa]|uniref:Nuclear pore complex protein NUP205 n=1 Tax=Trapa incisa TaxID=236973 RepID=A0AAN7LJL7_9MYRT|nr:hypothetical protein SAY87_017388 [Trapa incisa]
MVSSKQLLSAIESILFGPSPPSPAQRIELIHALRKSRSSFQSLLSYPPPKPSDRSQVQAKEVRLPDSPPITLEDQDVQIALKLSDDLYLNEIDSVRLLVSANQEWGLMGREPLEILRLAAGLWYTERRDLINALYTLLRAIVLDQGLEADNVLDIHKYLEDLITTGLRQRLISLIMELGREEPAGFGGPQCEPYILDSRGTLVQRQAVVFRERLILSHCLVLSVLIVRLSPKEVKDFFSILKDSVVELNTVNSTAKLQVTFSLLFSLIISFISDALSAIPDKASVLSQDASFRNEFHEMVMAPVNNPGVEAFVDGARLAWAVHLMIIQYSIGPTETASGSPDDLHNLLSCLEVISSNNVFRTLLEKVLRTAAFQNDDEDMVYMYNAYLHKLITCFLSHPIARDTVKESKEKAMTMPTSHRTAGSHDFFHEGNSSSQQAGELGPRMFVSLLEFISEIYQREPMLLSGNDVLWTFIKFAGEDHTNVETLVAFLKMLSTLALSQEGASKVFDLLQGKTFRSIGWSTLFDCLSIYADRFKQSVQTAGAMLPEFQEGDAKALVAYLNVLQKVMENGNPIERKDWFPDIEPLFKLLSYENVPPYLKGALRNAIATFIHVSPTLKDTIWRFLEQYDLPVVVGPPVGNTIQPIAPIYDMQFELNEIEARREQYPSTISFVNLINSLISEERDLSDRGQRFIGIFRFIYDHVFGPFPQRAYADPCEKWELVIACLQHFHMIMKKYEIRDQDVECAMEQSHQSSLQFQLPHLELLKDFMSGKVVFRNIMGILLPGVNTMITERTTKTYGKHLEKAVQLSLEIIVLVLDKDLLVSEFWRPLYQPLDVILSQDHNQIVSLLETVRYDLQPQIQLCSIRIMSILSSRMAGLVHLLLKANAANALIEDYAACLESRSNESEATDNANDPGTLIMQLMIDNISRPAPNITHLLLKFELDGPIERSVLQPKFHYSCLKVILDFLEELAKSEINSLLHEFGFQLLYELCLDPLTAGPTMDLLGTKKYHFFVYHLDTIGLAPLPKRSGDQALRISSLHQRAWLLKLLALELHAGDINSSIHRETCNRILSHLFGQDVFEMSTDINRSNALALYNDSEHFGSGRRIGKSKVLDLLEIVQFRSPDTVMKLSSVVPSGKFHAIAEEILINPGSSDNGGTYYYNERGDCLIDIAAFSSKLSETFNIETGTELNQVRETIQLLLRWAWKHNKNLEEQAAQLHMLTGWSHIVEISVSRKISLIENHTEILYEVLDGSLTASASPDCSLKMAYILTQVALTCMAKLRDERFLYLGGISSDALTCLDILAMRQLSNGACHSILIKLVMAILRQESSEALRRRQYALLLSYFQYCGHVLHPEIPTSIIGSLLIDELDGEDSELEKIDKEHAELAHANFLILKKEAQGILDLVTKDAVQGSEPGKALSFYVLDALICVDQEKYFLNQLQSRGFLRSSLMSIGNFSYHESSHSFDSSQRACTLEAELAFLLRISYKWGKSGARVLLSMCVLEHISSCKAINLHGSFGNVDTKRPSYSLVDMNKQRTIITPVLRLIFSLTSLVETSDIFEVKNKIVREIVDFIRGHQLLFDHALHQDIMTEDDQTMEQVNLVVGILSKVWPYEDSDDYSFMKSLYLIMRNLFSHSFDVPTVASQVRPLEGKRKLELGLFQLCFSLNSYLYFIVMKKSIRLQVSDVLGNQYSPSDVLRPSLTLVATLLNAVTSALERAAEEKSLLINKIRNINELSRQEVDMIISMCSSNACVSSSDNIQKRRYTAMVELCQVAGNRDQLVTLLLPLAEQILHVLLAHFQDSLPSSDASQAIRAIAYSDKLDSGHDISSLCGTLIPVLERLELLSQEKIGHDQKLFGRLVSSLKERLIKKMAL